MGVNEYVVARMPQSQETEGDGETRTRKGPEAPHGLSKPAP